MVTSFTLSALTNSHPINSETFSLFESVGIQLLQRSEKATNQTRKPSSFVIPRAWSLQQWSCFWWYVWVLASILQANSWRLMEKLTFSFSDRETKYGTVYRTVKTIITSNKWFLSIFISIPGTKRSSLQFSIVTFAIACDRNEVTLTKNTKHKFYTCIRRCIVRKLSCIMPCIIRKLPFCFSSIQFRAVRYTIHFLNSGNLIHFLLLKATGIPSLTVVTSLHYDRRTIREVTWSTGCIVTHLTVFSLPGQAKWWPHLNGPPWIITPSLRSPQKERWMDSRSTVEIQWYWAQIS